MKSKPVVVVGVLAAALVALILTSRRPDRPQSAPVPAVKAPTAAPSATKPTLETNTLLASYRVSEEPAPDATRFYRGANYRATVDAKGLSFEAGGHRISLGATRLEQGGAALDLVGGVPAKAGWAKAAVEKADGVVEEFVFENRRVEHLLRVDRPLGEGDLKVRVAVSTSLSGPVRQVGRGDSAWKDMILSDGGLLFTSADGTPGLAYHGAVAIDADGRRQLFDPRWENGEIALVLPAEFMKTAAYPVLIDPWLELDFSGSGGGVSRTGTVSETPAIGLLNNAPMVAWSDASDGDFDIFFRYWNGDAWTILGDENISNNDSKSTNPTIGHFTPTDTGFFHPFIAWEDDLSGTTNVYARFWTGSTWAELGGSAIGTGISLSLGTPCRNPQAIGLLGFVENVAPTPSRFEFFPCIVWEIEGFGLASRFFYPGDNRPQPPPARWYSHPSGGLITGAPSASRPSVGVDSNNRLIVAWEQSSGAQFDIFVARADTLTPGALTVSNGTPSPEPAGNWTAQNACAGLAPALSIQPSLAVAPNDDIWVAWQESVGGEREIYARRSVNFAAFADVSGSSTGSGISSTSVLGVSTTSSFPSITVEPITPFRPIVAWEDDAGGNLEIYLRRLDAGAWQQIADEGSAAPIGLEVGNSGGVSRNPSFSLRPKVIAATDSTITTAWRDGASGAFDLYVRRYHDNVPINLAQASVGAGGFATPLPTGGTSIATTIQFTGTLVAESSTLPTALRLQLEIRPNTTPFTSQPTHESLEVASGATATVIFTGLPNVNYHWRARSRDAQGRSSPWLPFGSNTDGVIDFRIDSSATGAGGPNTVVQRTEGKDKCGLTGLEAFALLGLAAALRRRRR